jgi:2-methylfumaryl-CoA hydratase
LVRAGRVVSLGPQAAPNPTSLREVSGRPKDPPSEAVDTGNAERARLPAELSAELPPRPTRGGFATFWEDLEVGDVFVHDIGRTVSEAEPMQLSTLFRNSHPLHVDERYCKQNSFVKTRVVYGGLVLSWLIALSSRDTAGNAIWDLGLDEGAHPSGVLAGDTLFGVTQVESKEPHGPRAGAVTLRIVGVKNTHPRALLEAGADLFTPELGKTEGKVKEKVVEFTRTLLLWRRSPAC